MRNPAEGKILILISIILLISGVVLGIVSIFPTTTSENQTTTIIDSTFRLTPQETYRQGLGSFRGGENVTIQIATSRPPVTIDFTLLTYSNIRFNSTSKSEINYSFQTATDYYEAVFLANTSIPTNVHFQVEVTKPLRTYDISWLGAPAKAMFLLGWASLLLLLLKPIAERQAKTGKNTSHKQISNKKNLRRLQIGVLLSFSLWIALLVMNTYPLATFENWYTDAARHPYTSVLFTKVGFSVFDTPLGKLSSPDASLYKFVTWAEMPNLYPLGSIFLFLPFSALLETGMAQTIVFKSEIALLLAISHVCLYLFLKHFWKSELDLSPRDFFLKKPWKQEARFILKGVSTYLIYVILVVYSANGQFDAIAMLFAIAALFMFLEENHEKFLFLAAVSMTFKYQAGIFLVPLILVSLLSLLKKPASLMFRNKFFLAAVALATIDLFTASLSIPFLITARPEFIMNGVNAFSAHAQLSWPMQSIAVLTTLAVTLTSALYLARKKLISALFMIFTLLPAFTLPYFQPWYLSFFFVYLLLPQSKRALEILLIWLIFTVLILSFGGLSYNPVAILDGIRRVIGI